MRIVRGVAVAAGGAFLAGALVACANLPAFGCVRPSASAPDIEFPFPDATSDLRGGWFIDVTAEGGPAHRVQVDTGSVGLTIAASAIPAGTVPGESASIHYSSSGKTLAGHVYRVHVAFIGSSRSARVRTATIPVLGVDRVTCDLAAHPGCVVAPGEANRVGVLGVGFGRRGSGADLADRLGTSERDVNPFLEIEDMRAGRMRRSYTISADRIVLGGSSESDGRSWRSVRLVRDERGDWRPLPGCFSVDGAEQPCRDGTVLVDTGVGTPIFATPDRPSGPVAAGTRLAIALAPKLSFSFTSTRACDGVEPSCARWSHRDTYPTFVNTSRRLLGTTDYRFDDDCGRAEFRVAREPSAGLVPVHRLYARENALGSEKPTR